MSSAVSNKYGRIGGARDGVNIAEERKVLLGHVPIFHSQGAVAQGTGAVTLTPAQLLSGLISDDPEGAQALTLPTAAALVAAIPEPRVGLTWWVCVQNECSVTDSTEGITVTTNTGCTLTAPTAGAVIGGLLNVGCVGWLYIRLTNVTSGAEAYTCHIVLDKVQASTA